MDSVNKEIEENKSNVLRLIMLISFLFAFMMYTTAPIAYNDPINRQFLLKGVENGERNMLVLTKIHHEQYLRASKMSQKKHQKLIHNAQNKLLNEDSDSEGEKTDVKCWENLDYFQCMWKTYSDKFAPEINLEHSEGSQNKTKMEIQLEKAHPKPKFTPFEGLWNVNLENFENPKFEIFLVAHSHQDLGWEKTLSEYYSQGKFYYFQQF